MPRNDAKSGAHAAARMSNGIIPTTSSLLLCGSSLGFPGLGALDCVFDLFGGARDEAKRARRTWGVSHRTKRPAGGYHQEADPAPERTSTRL